MVAPVQVCCRKCSVQGVEKHILGTLAGLTAMGFLGMLWAIRYFGGIPEEQEGDAVSADVSNTALGTNESSDLNASNVTNATNASASAVAPVDVVDPVAAALADQQAKSGANAVWTAMVTAMSTSFVCLILFSIVRPRLPQAYMARQEFWDDKADKETFKQLSKGFFSWLPELMNMREEELVFKVGFDGYIFLRCLFVDSTIFHCSDRAKAFYFTPPAFSNRLPHIAAKFCVCSLIPVGIPLMIISHFANWNSGDPVTLEGLTVGNIPSGDWRLWFFAVAAWYEVLLMLKLLRDEEFVYIRVRHQFLRSPRASDYSVLVLDLPKDYRTNKDLRDLFLHMHPDVHSATVLADCAKLDDLIATASKCSDDLAAVLKKKDRGQTMVGACCKKKRPIATEVEELECSLDKANTAMQNEQQAVKTKLRVTVQAERAAESVERQKSRRIADTRSIDDAAAVAKETAAEAMKLISARKMPEGKACMPCRLLWSITFGALCCSKHIGDTRRHGIVTFDNIRAATVARQVVHDSHVLDFHLTVNEAPDPGDILWRNMGAGNLERQLRSKIGTMLDFWLIAFWSVPVVFITSLVSIEALSKRMPWLKPVIEIEVVKGLLEGTVPALILAALLGLLPELLKKTTTYQGAMTHSEVERSAIGKYFFFLVFNVFLLASLSGSLFDSITVLIDDPTNLPNMLGKTLPAQSNFFIGYVCRNQSTAFLSVPLSANASDASAHWLQILLNGVSGFFVQLLTIGRVVSALLFRSKKTGPELSGGNPFPTDYVRSAAKLLLILVLAISYSVMAPLVLLPALMSFGTIYTVHKYLLIFMWESEFDSGGRMWPVFVTSVLFGLSVRL
eukprot:SAG31_NODE_917_length_11033_cov_3.285897_4_plen_846_part_00